MVISKKNKGALIFLVSATWAAIFGSTFKPAQAQDVPQTGSTATSSGELTEVVVTAQRRAESMQQVPISIDDFSAADLKAQQINSLDSVAEFSPGLDIARQNGSAYIALRGISFTAVTPGVDPTVGIYIDGVYIPSAAATAFTFNNLDSVEVDKGPQGTLFGRNAVGGVINITSKDPSQTSHMDIDAGYANYNTQSLNFYGTTGITDNLAANVAIYASRQGQGWGRNLYNGQYVYIGNELAGRTKWVLAPSDATKITLSLDWDRDRFPTGGSTYSLGVNDNISPVPTIGPPHIGGFYDTWTSLTPSTWDEFYGASLIGEQNFGWAQGRAIFGYHQDIYNNITGGAITISPPTGPQAPGAASGYFNTAERTSSEEFQLIAPSASSIQWIVGLYIFQDLSKVDPFETIPLSPASPTSYLMDQEDTKSLAGYTQVTVPIGPKLHATLGYRDTEDQRTVSGGSLNSLGVVSGVGSQSKEWTKGTYRAAIDYGFTKDILGYASYSTGFESGTYNILSGPKTNPVNPETINAWEVGLKSEVLEHKLRINVAGFYYSFYNVVESNYQVATNTTITQNAAQETLKGIDLDVEMVPTANFTIHGGLEMLDAFFAGYSNATIFLPTANPLSNRSTVGDDTGNYAPYTERFTANVGPQYVIPTSIGSFQLSEDQTYHSGLYMDAQNIYKQNPFTLVNASARWISPSTLWDITLWGKNLTNHNVGTQGQIGGAPPRYQVGYSPLIYGITFGYHWDKNRK